MSRLLRAATLVVCLTGALWAGGGHWARRLTLAASCGTSFWDAYTTRSAIARGALEGNSIFADAKGDPRWGRILGIKLGVCAGTALAQELLFRKKKSPALNGFWIGMNSALTARFTWVALGNRHLAGELKRTAATPSYLLAPK